MKFLADVADNSPVASAEDLADPGVTHVEMLLTPVQVVWFGSSRNQRVGVTVLKESRYARKVNVVKSRNTNE